MYTKNPPDFSRRFFITKLVVIPAKAGILRSRIKCGMTPKTLHHPAIRIAGWHTGASASWRILWLVGDDGFGC